MKFPLNIRIKDSVTALTLAAELGHSQLVKMFTEAGANLNKLSNKGVGPLYKAIEKGHTQIAHYLVKKGAKMVLSSKYSDMSPLFLVIKTQNVEMLQLFKKYNVDLSSKNSLGQNPLQYAAVNELTTIMNYLIKRMPNLDQEDDQGFNIFSRYVLMEKIDI
jgi:ankyrin repeat protein